MFKLNAFTIVFAAALALGANAQNFGLRADDNLCNGATTGYACAGSTNLPAPPLSNVPTFNPDRLVIGLPNTAFPGSPNCGDCYQLTYTTPTGEVRNRNVTVVNNSDPGFVNLCTTAYRALTGITGPLPPDGQIRVDLVERPRATCGL